MTAFAKATVSVLYLSNPEQDTTVENALVALRNCRVSKLLVYTPHHSSDFAFRVGMMVGRQKLAEAEWALNWPHLRQLLKARNIPTRARQDRSENNDFALFEVRQRIELSQEQLARALNVTARTLQNWETSKGTSQTRQHSTGGKSKLHGIRKRGNEYLRKILIHGARSVVLNSKRNQIQIGQWMTTLEARVPRVILVVAVANKLARIFWTVLSSGNDYHAIPLQMAA